MASLRVERQGVRSFEHSTPRMASRTRKRPQRAFPWRQTFLEQLRRNAKVNLACNAACISRNTVYTHLRRDARFRRQCEHARNQGRDEAYRLHLKRLETDPGYQRILRRVANRLGLPCSIHKAITLETIGQALRAGSCTGKDRPEQAERCGISPSHFACRRADGEF